MRSALLPVTAKADTGVCISTMRPHPSVGIPAVIPPDPAYARA